MPSIDWKWFIIGIIAGWFVVPMVQSVILRRRSAPAA